MPFITINTNAKLAQGSMNDVIEETTNIASKTLGKPVQYVTVVVNYHENMGFGGAGEKGAYIDVSSIGFGSKKAELVKKLSQYVGEAFNLDINSVSVTLCDLAAADYAKGGSLFG
jgi:phenylpyruvate tautomerase PptA (4-oxalocrotonate tautomerase family)